MDYTKSLINSAKGKLCDICKEYISELEADDSEFHYTKTSAKHDVFVHKNVGIKLMGSQGSKEGFV